MLEVSRLQHDAVWKHYDDEKLEGYIYKNVYPSYLFSNIQNTIQSIIEQRNTKSFMMSGTEIFINDKSIKLVNHAQNKREIIVLFDLTFEKEWFYQTNESIKSWADDKLKSQLAPQFLKTISILENTEPFTNKDYVFYRGHINYLAPNECLSLHRDAAELIYNDNTENTDYSITFYLYDHQEGLGGEFWSPNGFVYPPKANTALLLNGRKVTHGVTTNASDIPRLAFTLRAAHKNNLHLPGHPDKFIWDVMSSL